MKIQIIGTGANLALAELLDNVRYGELDCKITILQHENPSMVNKILYDATKNC